jgi:hypothetical protein
MQEEEKTTMSPNMHEGDKKCEEIRYIKNILGSPEG